MSLLITDIICFLFCLKSFSVHDEDYMYMFSLQIIFLQNFYLPSSLLSLRGSTLGCVSVSRSCLCWSALAPSSVLLLLLSSLCLVCSSCRLQSRWVCTLDLHFCLFLFLSFNDQNVIFSLLHCQQFCSKDVWRPSGLFIWCWQEQF